MSSGICLVHRGRSLATKSRLNSPALISVLTIVLKYIYIWFKIRSMWGVVSKQYIFLYNRVCVCIGIMLEILSPLEIQDYVVYRVPYIILKFRFPWFNISTVCLVNDENICYAKSRGKLCSNSLNVQNFSKLIPVSRHFNIIK